MQCRGSPFSPFCKEDHFYLNEGHLSECWEPAFIALERMCCRQTCLKAAQTHTCDRCIKESAGCPSPGPVNGLPSSCQFQLYANSTQSHLQRKYRALSKLWMQLLHNATTVPQWLILGSISGADWHQCALIEFMTSALRAWILLFTRKFFLPCFMTASHQWLTTIIKTDHFWFMHHWDCKHLTCLSPLI